MLVFANEEIISAATEWGASEEQVHFSVVLLRAHVKKKKRM